MGDAIHIENFSANDKKSVLDLLNEAELPIEDLTDDRITSYNVCYTKLLRTGGPWPATFALRGQGCER